MNVDLFGAAPVAVPFKDIRNTRPSVAEEKAALCLQIGELARKVPASVCNGSVNKVREWKAVAVSALKTAGSRRSAVPDLTAAITNLARFK